jgi:hypothetical protein
MRIGHHRRISQEETSTKRTPIKFVENKNTVVVEPHPLLRFRDAPPEPWEKSYWNNL